ncbi:MAG: hypothetical protein ABSC48_09085 [Terracidiphilus sp.]|jgi:hypothetical protein
MLIEIWERLRGYDKWVPVEARVWSASQLRKKLGKRYQVSPSSQFSGELLVWRDLSGETRFGSFVTHETSPLYQLLEGETIHICYNPSKPDHYYCRPHFLSWLGLITKASLVGLVCLGFIVWRIWRIITGRGF